MSLGQFALCEHAQSGNFLNLENISIIAICSGNVPVLTKDSNGLNHSEHVFGMLVFQCPVDRCSAIPDNENVIA